MADSTNGKPIGIETLIDQMNKAIEAKDLDTALQIAQQQLLPHFEKSDDKKSLVLMQSLIADILDVKGEIEDSIRMRTETIHPALLEQGDLAALCVSSRKLASGFLKRDQPGDRETAKEMLAKTFQLAVRLQNPEAQTIMNVMFHSGLETEESLKVMLKEMGFDVEGMEEEGEKTGAGEEPEKQ